MGLFNTCWQALLQVATYSSLLGSNSNYQQPLAIGEHNANGHVKEPSTGPSFKVAGTNFTCNYPSMKGYRSCNHADDRNCWLRPSDNRDTTYNIHTEYDTPGDTFTPVGVVREVKLTIMPPWLALTRCSIGSMLIYFPLHLMAI